MTRGQDVGGNETRTWRTPEFLLVIIMLIVLSILVAAVLLVPPLVWVKLGTGADGATGTLTVNLAKDLLDYKKTILSIILTAFGAWVGAGAAYYFGRENLRVASQSMLAMRGISPKERLRQTPIREVPPKALDWSPGGSDLLETILEKLKKEEERWFIPISKADGALDTVLHEEAVWRFIEQESQTGATYADIQKKQLSDVVTYVNTLPPKVIKRLMGIYVAVSPDKNAGEAYEMMNTKGVFIAIVVDEKGKPIQYFDTGDIRRLLLRFD